MFGLSGRQILILLVLVVFLFAGAQYGPAYYSAFQLNDYIHQEVTFAVTNRKNPEKIRAEVVKEAKELGIDITPKDVHITHRGPAFTVDLEYRWPINMRVYKHELVFHSKETGEMFE
jgi:hypothetical protein